MLAIVFFLAAAAVLAVQLRRKHSPEDLWVNRQKVARTAALEASDPAAGTGEADGGVKAEENKTKGEYSDDPA